MNRRYRSSTRHFQRNGQPTPCGLVNPAHSTSIAGSDVTCKRCLAAINNKTTEQGGSAPKRTRSKFTNVTLTSVSREHWLNTIKVVRELTDLGLKESKDIVDAVRDGHPRVLFLNCTQHQARKARTKLRETYAVVSISKKIQPLTQ